MKEYKIIKNGFFSKDATLEEALNQYAREGWCVATTSANNGGGIVKVILERDKNRNNII